MLKRIVTIQDISCFGKCSLTVALPILSAMGIETAVIPTAVLSTHTGGFTGYTFRDLTEDIPKIAEHWKSLQLEFHGICVGYLGSQRQMQMVADFFDAFRKEGTTVVVDPVMGDGGKMYAGFTEAFVDEMRRFCGKADVISPNLTEAALLLNKPYQEIHTEQEIQQLLLELSTLGADTVVLTGVRYQNGMHGAAAYCRSKNRYYNAFRPHIDQPAHGTGDIFTSVLSGAIVNGMDLQRALQMAVDFTADCIAATTPDKEQYWYGVSFEKCLGHIADLSRNSKGTEASY